MVTDENRCTRCGSSCAITCGAGRAITLGSVTVRVPESLPLLSCDACGSSYPTTDQVRELRDIADRDWLGDGGRGSRPSVFSGT